MQWRRFVILNTYDFLLRQEYLVSASFLVFSKMFYLIDISQISFLVVTTQIFRVFLKVFMCILNLYFCCSLNDLDIGHFIGTAIDDTTKYKLLINHLAPDHNYEDFIMVA